MNRTIIATATILAVAAVAIFGMRAYSQATSASMVTVHDADVNWDGHINVADMGNVASRYGQQVPAGGRPVREQNLDGSGNIKVAQQGPIDVNVVSEAPNVPRLIPLGQNIVPIGQASASCGDGCTYTSAGAQTTFGSFVDVSDCEHLDVLTEAASGGPVNPLQLVFRKSFDGAMAFGETSAASISPGASVSRDSQVVTWGDIWSHAPYLQFAPYLHAGSVTGGQPLQAGDVTLSAWLYCS